MKLRSTEWPRLIRHAQGRICLLFLLAFASSAASGQAVFTDIGSNVLQIPLMSDGLPPRLEGGATTGDFDKDGDLDVVISTSDNRDLYFRNNGDATFTEIGAQVGFDFATSGGSLAAGDIDNDGDLDIVMNAYFALGHYLYINDGQGNFTEEAVLRNADVGGGTIRNGRGIALGDYDKDGYLDIFIAEWKTPWSALTPVPPISRLLRNRGAAEPGYFDDVTAAAGVIQDIVPGRRVGTFPFTPSFADLDRDGWPDLVIASDFDESRLYWNNGDGTFTDGTVAAGYATGRTDMGMETADLNGDGLLDIVTTAVFFDEDYDGIADNHLDGNRLFLNNGDRTFTDATDAAGIRNGYWGWGATGFDYDNDGDLDLVQANGFTVDVCPPCLDEFPPTSDLNALFENDPSLFFENLGNAIFIEKASQVGLVNTEHSVGVIAFDFDEDGDQDVLHMNVGSQPNLFRNDVANDNDWISIKLISNHRQSDGIGAVITVTLASGVSIVREVSGSGSFMAQDGSGSVHIGLGDLPDGSLVDVKVDWPGGLRQSYTGQMTNQAVTYIESLPTSVSISADKPNPSPIHTVGPITFSAVGQGGSGNYEYQFWIRDPFGTWFLVQNYGPADTYTAPPDLPGSYQILARLRNVGGTADFDAQASMLFEVLPQPPVDAVGISADTVSPAAIDGLGNVRFTAAPGNGTENVEYQFWMQLPDASWELQQAYGGLDHHTASLPLPGSYKIVVQARVIGREIEFEAMGSMLFEVLDVPSAGGLTLTADKNSPAWVQSVGAIEFTATAPGQPADHEYQYWLQNPGGVWNLVQHYSAANSWSASLDVPGDYVVLARGRQVGSTAAFEEQAVMGFEILDQPRVSAVGISADTASPVVIPVSSTVTFTAAASGGSNDVEYQFWLQAPDGSWTLQQTYSNLDTFTTTPTVAGEYSVIVYARNAGVASDFEAMGAMKFEVVE